MEEIKYYEKKLECMPQKKLQTLQLKRLKKIVKYVYDNVPTYRKKMDDAKLTPSCIKTLKDIEKLPFTEKHDLRENYPFGMFSAPLKDIIRVHASSGTTGKLTVVGYTKNDLHNWARMVARALVSVGVDKEDIVHICYGYGLFTGGLGLNYGSELIGATTVPASSGNTKRQIELLKDFKATTLCCTPSYATFIADELKEENLTKKHLNLKTGIFGAEFWSENMRKRIEKSLGIDAYDIYGLSEIMGHGVAVECKHKCGLHVQEDEFYPEIIDMESLKQVEDGKQGELVITTLTKEGIPLIRYRTHDITSISHKQCKCGRTSARLSKILGRSDDMLIIRGVNVYPSQVESALMNIGKMIEPNYLITIDRVDELDTMQIEVELSKSASKLNEKQLASLQKRIFDEVKSMITTSAKIILVPNGTLAKSEGKAKRVVDKRKF